MGNKSSKEQMASKLSPGQQAQFNEANPGWQRALVYNNSLAVEQRKNANLAAQERQQQQQRPQERHIGSTSYLSSADNTFKFVVDASITAPIEFQEVQNVKPNAKVPITKFNFFFVRHAKSCANEQSGLLNLKKLKLDDPFISNDGIFATIEKQNEYDEFFKNYDVDHYFCSPLIRTWCTAAMLFPNHISDFEIAPHLREDAYFNYSNHPYPYETNVQRFRFFSDYVETLTDGKTKTIDVPGYALMNKAFADYGSDFVDQKGIELFMQWYIKNENTLGRTNSQIRNVVVTCHSESLKTFCNAHLNESQLKERGMGGGDAFFKHTNNYCIQVQVVMDVRPSNQVQHGRPLTTPEREEVKLLVAKQLADPAAKALNDKIAKLTQAEAATKLAEAEAELQKLHADNAALGENLEPIVTQAQRLVNETRAKQLEMAIAHMKQNSNIPSAGGNKRKQTKRVKRTKSTKRQNKKTRAVKQRGGGNKYFDALEKNLPFSMTITKVIDGTPDIARDPRAKHLDCICEPDAYQDPVKTFECAKTRGQDDSRGFAFRQNPKNAGELEINKDIRAKVNQAAAEAAAA